MADPLIGQMCQSRKIFSHHFVIPGQTNASHREERGAQNIYLQPVGGHSTLSAMFTCGRKMALGSRIMPALSLELAKILAQLSGLLLPGEDRPERAACNAGVCV